MLTVFNDYGNHYYGSGSLTMFMASPGANQQDACKNNYSTYYHNGSYGSWALATAIFNTNDTGDPASPGFYSGPNNSSPGATVYVRYWDGQTLSYPQTCPIDYFGYAFRNDGYAIGGGYPGGATCCTNANNNYAPFHNSNATPNPGIFDITNFFTGVNTSQHVVVTHYSYNSNYSGTASYEWEIYTRNTANTAWNTTPSYTSGLQFLYLSTGSNNGGATDSNSIVVSMNQKLRVKLYNPSPNGILTIYGFIIGSQTKYNLA